MEWIWGLQDCNDNMVFNQYNSMRKSLCLTVSNVLIFKSKITMNSPNISDLPLRNFRPISLQFRRNFTTKSVQETSWNTRWVHLAVTYWSKELELIEFWSIPRLVELIVISSTSSEVFYTHPSHIFVFVVSAESSSEVWSSSSISQGCWHSFVGKVDSIHCVWLVSILEPLWTHVALIWATWKLFNH